MKMVLFLVPRMVKMALITLLHHPRGWDYQYYSIETAGSVPPIWCWGRRWAWWHRQWLLAAAFREQYESNCPTNPNNYSQQRNSDNYATPYPSFVTSLLRWYCCVGVSVSGFSLVLVLSDWIEGSFRLDRRQCCFGLQQLVVTAADDRVLRTN